MGPKAAVGATHNLRAADADGVSFLPIRSSYAGDDDTVPPPSAVTALSAGASDSNTSPSPTTASKVWYPSSSDSSPDRSRSLASASTAQSKSRAGLWRLHRDLNPSRHAQVERAAPRIVGWCFLALAAYIAYESGSTLIRHEAPERSILGIVIASVSVFVMPLLARAKRRVAAGKG